MPCAVPQGMTLENIIDLTGELEHLNELDRAPSGQSRRIYQHRNVFFHRTACFGFT